MAIRLSYLICVIFLMHLHKGMANGGRGGASPFHSGLRSGSHKCSTKAEGANRPPRGTKDRRKTRRTTLFQIQNKTALHFASNYTNGSPFVDLSASKRWS